MEQVITSRCQAYSLAGNRTLYHLNISFIMNIKYHFNLTLQTSPFLIYTTLSSQLARAISVVIYLSETFFTTPLVGTKIISSPSSTIVAPTPFDNNAMFMSGLSTLPCNTW